MNFSRCTVCVMPTTRPDTEFVDGVCAACLSYAKRPSIDWDARKRELTQLLETRYKAGAEFDCIVPSSAGKDSHYQVLKLIELGAKPLVVTATTCMLTEVGRANIDNLKRYATTIEVSPNAQVRAKLNRIGLEMVGDISWPEHVAIFTTPFKIAVAMQIPLIFYGENPQNQYGGPLDSTDAKTMTARWVSEFGGFLGLRPQDLIGHEGLSERDMADYMAPDVHKVAGADIEAHFLGQYIPWDSRRNIAEARAAGMQAALASTANWWYEENQDNAMTGIHDHQMYRKYGYGRGCAQISVDVRTGWVPREFALEWVNEQDGLFPYRYMNVRYEDVLNKIGMSVKQFDHYLDLHTNWDLFDGVQDRRPILKC